jgi:3-mercaptopyruvate sulfurtransferase SseA
MRTKIARTFLSFVIVIVTAVALLTACNSNDSSANNATSSDSNKFVTQTPADGVKRITVNELKAAVDKGAVLIIDTRGPEVYTQEHIKGSINILEANLDSRISGLPRDKMIVTYCS